MRRLGYFVTESSEHNAEYNPFFIPRGPGVIAKYGVPIDEYLRRCDGIVDEFERMLLDFGYVWPNAIPAEMRSHIARVAQPRIATLADFAPLVAFFADRPKLSKAELALPKRRAPSPTRSR